VQLLTEQDAKHADTHQTTTVKKKAHSTPSPPLASYHTQSGKKKQITPMPIVLQRFDLRLKSPTTIFVLAKRGSGKSVFMKDLMQQNKGFFYKVYVFAGSISVKKDYEDIIPAEQLVEEFKEEDLEGILNEAKEMTLLCQSLGIPPLQYGVLMDDLACDRAIFTKKPVVRMMMNGRHDNVTPIVASQFFTAVGPRIRSQSDIVAVLRETSQDAQKSIYKTWFSIIPKFETFQDILCRATENYGVLIACTTAISNNLQKNIFTYRAQQYEHPESLCSRKVWRARRSAQIMKYIKKMRYNQELEEAMQSGGMIV
jgi:hypothetical protein